MSIRNKLLFNVLIAIVSTLIMGIVGFIFTSNVANVSLQLFDNEALPVIKINQMEKNLQGELLRLIGHVSTEDPDKMDQLTAEIGGLSQQLDSQIRDYQHMLKTVHGYEKTQLFDLFLAKRMQFDEVGKQVVSLRKR